MANVQEIFNRIQESKREKRQYMDMYKDALDSSKEYKEILEQLKTLKTRKKEIELRTQEDMGNDYTKIDILKLDMKHDQEMLSDAALNSLIKGQPVKVVDKDKKEYEPVFTVRFKKQSEAA